MNNTLIAAAAGHRFNAVLISLR